MAVVYPRDLFNDLATWPRARRLDAIALPLVGRDAAVPGCAELPAADLMNRLGSYRQGALGAYAAARPLHERALAIRERALGPDHPDTATSLNNFAGLLYVQGDLAAARPLFERALAIRERALGPDHPDTALSLNNLALLLKDQGDLVAARPLFERALAICEKALGPEHTKTGKSLGNLARLLEAQGDLAAARPLYERAGDLREGAWPRPPRHRPRATKPCGPTLLDEGLGLPISFSILNALPSVAYDPPTTLTCRRAAPGG
jgi:tetratricopeptide (TPR) repeat protein